MSLFENLGNVQINKQVSDSILSFDKNSDYLKKGSAVNFMDSRVSLENRSKRESGDLQEEDDEGEYGEESEEEDDEGEYGEESEEEEESVTEDNV